MGYDTDVMIVAVVGKLLVFALAFLLLWFGNRRGGSGIFLIRRWIRKPICVAGES